MPRVQRESIEQQSLMAWCESNTDSRPELAMIFHIPNGGLRRKREAARLKREGVKPGIPDICLPVPKGMYHGLWVEMKAEGNYAKPEQKKWLRNLNLQGYYATCVHGWLEAKFVLESYLDNNLKKLC